METQTIQKTIRLPQKDWDLILKASVIDRMPSPNKFIARIAARAAEEIVNRHPEKQAVE